jgi:hypothetical protein
VTCARRAGGWALLACVPAVQATARPTPTRRRPSPPFPSKPRTQFTLRTLWYPYLIWAFYKEWRAETAACGNPWNPILTTPLMQAFLTGLNLLWTRDLVGKLLRQRREAAAAGAGGGQKYGKHL